MNMVFLVSEKGNSWTVYFQRFVKSLGLLALALFIIFGTIVTGPKNLAEENQMMSDLQRTAGTKFPGFNYRCSDRKNWMSAMSPEKVRINQIIWPGTHDSATNGLSLFVRPFTECQTRSIYEQLIMGTRVLDIRINGNRMVSHGTVSSYSVDNVFNDVKRFLHETQSEIIILEIRTEFGHHDPPDFANYIIDQLGEYLIHHDDQVFNKTISEVLPKRVICIWKPRNSPEVDPGGPVWSSLYLQDDWIDTSLPYTKFESNMQFLGDQPLTAERNYFYRVENTVTPRSINDPFVSVTDRIKPYARLFISQSVSRGIVDSLQILSTDFISEDFVDACIGLTYARIAGKV